jgi:hypothetical protein
VAGARLGAHARSGREGTSGREVLREERGRMRGVLPGQFQAFLRDGCLASGDIFFVRDRQIVRGCRFLFLGAVFQPSWCGVG